jgi:L-ascorbate metabolism protein UlaG (beta-lactamase superfamily)
MVSEANLARAAAAAALCGALAGCQAPPTHLSCTPLKEVLDRPTDRVRVTYFGTSTLMIDDGKTALMTDGFFSRPGKGGLIFGTIAPDPGEIDFALQRGRVPKLEAIFVAHSHHDHAMDSAVVAKCSGAMLAGTLSTRNIGRPDPDRTQALPIGGERRYGDFSVEAFESRHSPGLLTALLKGDIEDPFDPPAHAFFYKEGGSYSFVLRHPRGTILVHPSAGAPAGVYRGVRADVVFLGIGTLGNQGEKFARDYWDEVVRTTGAKLVIPIHWDDITISLRKGLQPAPRPFDNYDEGIRLVETMATKDKVRVCYLAAFGALEFARGASARTTGGPPCPFELPPATPSAPR